MTQTSQPMTKEQFLQQIGEIITKYEDDTEQIVGVYVHPDMNNFTEVYQWDGEKFSEGRGEIEIKEVEGTTEFYVQKEENIKKRIMDPGYMESLKIKKDV
jgi:hypothetical protein